MKVEIYDPAMCCSSGLCGPAIDPVLIKVNDAKYPTSGKQNKAL